MNPNIIFDIVAFLFAISIHESAHAWSANKLGDPTARMLGRITLNPLRHIDPVGTVLMPLVAAVSGLPLFGWAKPTPVDTRHLRNPRRDDVLVSGAGPTSNFLVAIIALLLLLAVRSASPLGEVFVRSLPFSTEEAGASLLTTVALLLYRFLLINLLLGVFNLIPVPPLDGSHILAGLLPSRLRFIYDEIGRFGFLLLILLIMTDIPLRLFRPVLLVFVAILRS